MNEKFKRFFFACKFATSMMNLMTVIIFSLVVGVFALDLFQQAVNLLSSVALLVIIDIVCLLVMAYCLGTIVYAIFVYMQFI